MINLSKYLTMVNAGIVNISIIIGTILTFYFISLYLATNKNRTNLSFVPSHLVQPKRLRTVILVGFLLGFISFILSINRIPILGASNGVDMRYVMIYFAVIYGSELLGVTTASSLVILKYLSYFASTSPIPLIEYINNALFTFLILILGIYIKRKKFPIFKTHILFLSGFMITRFLMFSIYFHPFLQTTKLTEFFLYVLIYSGIFLLSTYIINVAISVSQSVHVYRTAAVYDSLTNVYNKESFHFFLDYVANTKSTSANLSLSVIDIDDFKDINDNYGHPTGDAALAYLSTVLKKYQSDFKHYICRIGGDEFAIIHNESPTEAEDYYRKVFYDINNSPLIKNEEEIFLELSVGLTHFKTQEKPVNSEFALKMADDALYQAKKRGKRQLVITRA